jgi:thiol:disulfide interchange protein DsbD
MGDRIMAQERGRGPYRAGLGLLCALCVGLLMPASAIAAAPPSAKKLETTADRIDFSVAVETWPEDPFSDANQAGISSKEVAAGSVIRVVITGKPRPGFHTYPLTRRADGQDEGQLSSLTFKEAPEAERVFWPLYPVKETQPEQTKETSGTLLEHKGPFTWSQYMAVSPAARPGSATLQFTITVQVCDASTCLTGDHPFAIPLTITPAATVNNEAAAVTKSWALPMRDYLLASIGPGAYLLSAAEAALSVPPAARKVELPLPPGLSKERPPLEVVPVSGVTGDSDTGPTGGSGLGGFILQGIFWGAISLVTPCVFPMIPITVSFFLKQSEKKHHRPLPMALVYCATIIFVLTISAVALLSIFTLISTHQITNFFMGALFIFFALSLFGMYEIELPHSLAQFTSSREGQGGVIGTIFMALTFTIISFACVAPFLGGFAGTASQTGMPWSHRLLGGLAFSTTFAAPFFLLALFPTMLKRLPKAGSWMNSVKVVMGFLELAAALKFFRAGERVWLSESTFFTFDMVLAAYVLIAFLAGTYLLGWYRLPHDSPLEHLGVGRMLFALAFLSLAGYMAPGLMKSYDPKTGQWYNQRPSGAVYSWVESFLLPDTEGDMTWTGDMTKGLAEASQKRQMVFVDFTGVTCTNCAWNEANVLNTPTVRDLLAKYKLVQLYTDRVPNKLYSAEELDKFGSSTSQQKTDAQNNRELQAQKFNTNQLPLYVILQPTDDRGGYKEVARYAEGKINNPQAFEKFLRRPLRGR